MKLPEQNKSIGQQMPAEFHAWVIETLTTEVGTTEARLQEARAHYAKRIDECKTAQRAVRDALQEAEPAAARGAYQHTEATLEARQEVQKAHNRVLWARRSMMTARVHLRTTKMQLRRAKAGIIDAGAVVSEAWGRDAHGKIYFRSARRPDETESETLKLARGGILPSATGMGGRIQNIIERRQARDARRRAQREKRRQARQGGAA